MILSKWEVCNCKKLKFVKEQEAKGLVSKLTVIISTAFKWFTYSKYFVLKVKTWMQ